MNDYSKPAKSQPIKCPQCGSDVEQTPGAGRVRQFCTPWHGRQWRKRMSGWAL
ncbi:hypothetical protein [Streptomyces sp. NBC_00344]|uniref:hypothetical protein n=1 Tax=Streptomyces sp. NBC_00344 TaxID=2975720 RepID=UPI002E2221E4